MMPWYGLSAGQRVMVNRMYGLEEWLVQRPRGRMSKGRATFATAVPEASGRESRQAIHRHDASGQTLGTVSAFRHDKVACNEQHAMRCAVEWRRSAVDAETREHRAGAASSRALSTSGGGRRRCDRHQAGGKSRQSPGLYVLRLLAAVLYVQPEL